MAGSVGKSLGKSFVWLLLALLIVGLAGFGVGGFGGGARGIGAVGEREIDTGDYARALRQGLGMFGATLDSPEGAGIAAQVRAQLITEAALDGEAARIGLSVGDGAVREALLGIAAFHGVDGTFDREAYAFSLERAGLSEAAFEARLRDETARTLLEAAVGARLPAAEPFVTALVNHLAERRGLAVITLGPDDLESPVPAPAPAALEAFHTENAARYTAPETRTITYVMLTPEIMAPGIAVDEPAIRALYEARIAQYRLPERRLVERLVFASAEAAAQASARLAEGSADFATLAAERGLDLGDIDLGDVTLEELGAAGAAVFALEGPGVTPPQDTALGPAIFRVNAILPASETSFEEARDGLRDELALERALAAVDAQIEPLDDSLAAGATLEELARETPAELGQIAFNSETYEGIAADPAFRAAAQAAAAGDFPELTELEGGGVFALRLEGITPPALRPLAEIAGQVEADWRAAEIRTRLRAQAEALQARLGEGLAIEALGLPVRRTAPATFEEITPPVLAEPLFALSASGESAVVDEGALVHLVQLGAIELPEPTDPGITALREALAGEAAAGVARDMRTYFTQALVNSAGLTLDQAAIAAVHAQFP